MSGSLDSAVVCSLSRFRSGIFCALKAPEEELLVEEKIVDFVSCVRSGPREWLNESAEKGLRGSCRIRFGLL